MSNSPYKKIHIVINPASGKNEPIINVLNDVFHQYDDVDWVLVLPRSMATPRNRHEKQHKWCGFGGWLWW
ncbi:MAG: hypothetical protein IPH82_21695 [Chloroflexi bacterium]|nr:hypothetical protein [Chloroflexota bacterium]